MPDKSKHKEKRTNATLRLVKVLEKLDGTSSTNPTVHVLQDALGITSDDPNLAPYVSFSVFHRMIEFAEKEARAHYADEWETLGPHFTGVRWCFTPSLSHTQWNQRKSLLTGADLTGLRHTGVHLRRHVHENLIGEEKTRAGKDDIDMALLLPNDLVKSIQVGQVR
jgi:hypothetical protein